MENKAHALIAGIFIIVLAIAAILLGMWFNRDRVERVPYELATKLSIPGLSPQAAVRYRGLDVGKVDDITFDKDVPGQILVHISVRPDTPMTKSTYGTLGYQGVTGIAYVQLDDDGHNPVMVTSSKDHIARIEMRPSLLDQLQSKGLAILIQTEEMTTRMNALLTPEHQKTMLAAFDDVSKAANEIETIPRRLQPTLDKMPALAMEMHLAMTSIKKFSTDADTLAIKLQASDGAVDRLSSAAEQVGSVANRIETEALPLTRDLRASMRVLNRTLDGLNERPQSILFGSPATVPGPGEAGFGAPTK